MSADDTGLSQLIAFTQEVEKAFPRISHSTCAIDGFPDTQAQALRLVHRVLTSNGWKQNEQPFKNPQLFLTIADAVQALRFHWLQYLANVTFEVADQKPYHLCWRHKPDVAEYHGVWRASMRFTPIFVDRDGVLVTWSDMPTWISDENATIATLSGKLRDMERENTQLRARLAKPWWKRMHRGR